MRTKSAFSLIELLVVLAIVAILSGLFFTLLQKTRQMAHTTQCLSNLRQVGMAFPLYLSENSGAYPKQASGNFPPGGGATWWEVVGPYAGWEDMHASSNVAANTFMHCPEHTEYPGSFSYFANDYIIKKPQYPAVYQDTILSPSSKILLYEVHTHCQWPQASHASGGVGKKPFIPAYANPTHGNACNHLYADGHVESNEGDLSRASTWWDPFTP